MPKLVVDLQRGLIEVEASDQLVTRIYSDIRDELLSRLASNPVQPDDADPDTHSSPEAIRARKRVRGGGPSCASRIESIKEEGFFKEPKGAAEVREKLKERGTTYASNNIAAALTNLTKASKLRRFNDKGWKYQNP